MATSTPTINALGSLAVSEALAHLDQLSIPHSILSRIPYHLAVEYFILPHGIDSIGRLEVLMAYPFDVETLQSIQLHTNALLRPTKVPKDILLKLIAKHYGSLVASKEGVATGAEAHTKGPGRLSINRSDSVVNIVNDIVHEAIRLRASDIHFEPFERELCVRFRIDGVLQEMASLPSERTAQVTSRLKVLSRMDIAERRRSQDGRFRIAEQGKDVDVRVSSLPTDFGEKVVLRLLDKSSFDFNLESIGMEQAKLALFRQAIQMPNGIVLLTGPTGSGKSTSLYGVMNYLKRPGVNISTVEDPIEYNIRGVNQTQVNLATGMTFANSLRTLLRQDPDIIMVGEMRDQETAEIAIRASLTGHLVLSTLHTNDAASAVTRLIDMGIAPYLVSSSLTMIVAQRLVRKICVHCRCEDTVSEEVKKGIGLTGQTPIFKGLGCSACGYTGYRGRTGIFEVLAVSDAVRKLVNAKAYAGEIRDQAAKEGLVTLRDDCLAKLVNGVTSLEEVIAEISVLA
jgi:type IV pilus assembly protein PilB